MNTEPNDQVFVDPDTDDLEDFASLINGKAKPTPPVEDPKDEDLSEDEPLVEDDTVEDAADDPQDDDADGQEDLEEKPKAPKKVNRVQERINQLVTERETEKREKLELQRRLEALENGNKKDESANPVPQVSVQTEGPDPDAKNEDGSEKYPLGEFDPKYIRDMARHTIEQEWTARKEQEEQERVQQEHQIARDMLQNKWQENLTPVMEQHDDYMEKTVELENTFQGLDPKYSDYIVQTIKSLDHGPEVLYYFANNLDEAKRFVDMGPLKATLALGEINAMFKGNTRKEAKVSKAPPPPQANKGAKMRASVSEDTDDLDAFAKLLFNKSRRS